MQRQLVNQTCACRCGESRFTVSGTPLARFYCHCTICQSLYQKPYVDVTAMWAGAVLLPNHHHIGFKKYRSPPALSRGLCPSCNAPMVGFMSLLPRVGVAFIASHNFADTTVLPKPTRHIFYHRRVGEVADTIPKISGYWPSELAVVKLVIGSMFR